MRPGQTRERPLQSRQRVCATRLLDRSQQNIEGRSSRQRRAHVQHYIITRQNVKATPFMQPINLVSLATTFILT